MNSAALYDFSPALRLMVMGAALAAGPLAWVWLRQRGKSTAQRLRQLTLLTLFLTFDLVLFGAFTRLTDSGLGCPDWPGCYGHASPVAAHAQISAAQQAMPTGPVTHGKAWVEMIHRYLATSVGVLILVLAAYSWWHHRRQRAAAAASVVETVDPWWATLTLVWVCVQGAFGALTVTMKLFPLIVTLHLLGGIFLLVLLTVQAVKYAQLQEGRVWTALPAGLSRWLLVCAALLALQIALGGWVSTNYAVLACNEFPTCQGSWWPEMNFSQGFVLWRALGLDAAGAYLDFQALTAIHYVHRLVAYAVFVALGVLAWRLHAYADWRRSAQWLGALLALQFLTGLSNVVLDWPLIAAVLHTGGAAALAVVLTQMLAHRRQRPSSTAAHRGTPVSAAS